MILLKALQDIIKKDDYNSGSLLITVKQLVSVDLISKHDGEDLYN